MSDLEYLLILNSIPEVGFIRINNLIKRFGGLEEIFGASRSELEKVDKVGPKIADVILNCDRQAHEREMKLAEKSGAKIITYLDSGYPANLKDIYDPPVILYVKGDILPEDKFAVALVGSRRASRYGLQTAERLGCELAGRGITVVSGLARGIDAAGHKGALKAKGRTIAVLGSGLANVYPPEHQKLADEIIRSGALISEFPMECEPYKDNFPRRNRVISGLSLGTVVVEAAKDSGALITTDFALEQGRELFAVPGHALTATASGTNMLIRQGAKLVESADDIIEELDGAIRDRLKTGVEDSGKAAVEMRSLGASERRIFETLGDAPVSVDEIIEETEMPAAEAMDCLTRMEIKGVVERLPGRSYVRKGQ